MKIAFEKIQPDRAYVFVKNDTDYDFVKYNGIIVVKEVIPTEKKTVGYAFYHTTYLRAIVRFFPFVKMFDIKYIVDYDELSNFHEIKKETIESWVSAMIGSGYNYQLRAFEYEKEYNQLGAKEDEPF